MSYDTYDEYRYFNRPTFQSAWRVFRGKALTCLNLKCHIYGLWKKDFCVVSVTTWSLSVSFNFSSVSINCLVQLPNTTEFLRINHASSNLDNYVNNSSTIIYSTQHPQIIMSPLQRGDILFLSIFFFSLLLRSSVSCGRPYYYCTRSPSSLLFFLVVHAFFSVISRSISVKFSAQMSFHEETLLAKFRALSHFRSRVIALLVTF